jgi:hypothetical protein
MPLSNSPTIDWQSQAAQEPAWRQENFEIQPGTTGILLAHNMRPLTTRIEHGLTPQGQVVTVVRDSNNLRNGETWYSNGVALPAAGSAVGRSGADMQMNGLGIMPGVAPSASEAGWNKSGLGFLGLDTSTLTGKLILAAGTAVAVVAAIMIFKKVRG